MTYKGWYAIKPNKPNQTKRIQRKAWRELHMNATSLAQRLECSPMARETWVQSQVESYQRL